MAPGLQQLALGHETMPKEGVLDVISIYYDGHLQALHAAMQSWRQWDDWEHLYSHHTITVQQSKLFVWTQRISGLPESVFSL